MQGLATPEDDDDFEIVPLQKDSDDENMWDVEDDNEDAANAEKIRSTLFPLACLYFH